MNRKTTETFASLGITRESTRATTAPDLQSRLMEMSEIIREGSRWNGNEQEFAVKEESDVAMLDDILGDCIRLAAREPAPVARDPRMAELLAAADSVVARWDSPKWKDEAPTADYIARLRRAADACRSGDKANSAPPADSVNAVLDAARKLVKAKGRYHTEQNYKALMEATHAHDTLAAALSSMDGAAGTHTKESTK